MLLYTNSDVIELNKDSFSKGPSNQLIVSDKRTDGKVGLMVAYAHWCPHCRNVVPTYKELASLLKKEKNMAISAFECSDGECSQIASQLGVNGYPTFFFLECDGSLRRIEEVSRSVDGMLETMCSQVMTCANGKKKHIKKCCKRDMKTNMVKCETKS